MELEDNDFEPTFIGRETYLVRLEDAWQSHAIFGIFGTKSVGKSRLTREFLKRKKTKLQLDNDDFMTIDMKYFDTTVESLNAILLSSFQNTNTIMLDKWKEQIVKLMQNKIGLNQGVLVFDNADGFLENDRKVHDEFLSLCVMLVKHCRGLKIFVTSSIKFVFTQIRSAYFQMELLPMTKSETVKLLRQESGNVKLDDFEEELAELCEGLPKLVMMTVAELTEDDALLQPEEMVELLSKDRLKCLSREFYPSDDRILDDYNNFLMRLSEARQNQLASLKTVSGSFDADEARDILGLEKVSTVKDQVLIPIKRRQVVTYDPRTKQFDIQGVLKDCLNTLPQKSNCLDEFGSVKAEDVPICCKKGNNKQLESVRCFGNSVGALLNRGYEVSCADNTVKPTLKEDQMLLNECKTIWLESVVTTGDKENSAGNIWNSFNSYCVECCEYSLTDNTAATGKDHFINESDKKDESSRREGGRYASEQLRIDDQNIENAQKEISESRCDCDECIDNGT